MRLRIRTKVLLAIAVLLFLVVGATDLVWIGLIRPILTSRLQESQQQIGYRAADNVQNFLDAKVRALILHTQSAAFLTQDENLKLIELRVIFSQDRDIEKISLINPDGFEKVFLTNSGGEALDTGLDKRHSPAYLATTFRYGKEYISEVSFIEKKPFITIAVPIIVPETSYQLTELTTGNPGAIRQQDDILGVLEATVNLSNLFGELTKLGTEQSGSVYVVDRNGAVIAHQDPSFINDTVTFLQFPPVQHFVDTAFQESSDSTTEQVTQFINEKNEPVLGTFVSIPRTPWAVVIQQPSSLALADLSKVTTYALLMLGGGMAVAGLLAYYMSKKFTDPIHDLVNGAHILGTGNLNYNVDVQTHDELSDLADAFNKMAFHLSESRKKLEQDNDIISAERNKLEVILSGISDAVIAVDTERRIILFNAAAEELSGYKQHEVYDKHLSSIIRFFSSQNILPEDMYCPVRNDDFEGVLWSAKGVKLKTNRQKEPFVNIVSSQISGGAKVGIGCILTLHDVTKEQQLEEMKMDFVSMAAHELRTPLTSIQGYADLLINRKERLDLDMKSSLQNLLTNCARLSNLIDNLLNASRIEQGRLTINVKPMDLRKLITEVAESLSHQAAIKQQTLQVIGLPQQMPQVMIDSFMIREVITNLIANAINYTPVQGRIVVTSKLITEQNLSYVSVSVTDTGYGIDKEALTKLFTKFYRVGSAMQMETKGSGLGLFISKSIIDQHHGKIWVESELGKGSTFTFTVPVATESSIMDYQQRVREGKVAVQHQGIIINPNKYH